MIRTLIYAVHTAHLDPMTGEGVLVLPCAEDDLPAPDDGLETLHSADWNHAIAHLASLGWEPSEADDGGLIYDGTTDDGHLVVGLYGREPVVTMPSIEDCANAWVDMSAHVGISHKCPVTKRAPDVP